MGPQRHHLFNTDKLAYVKGKKPDVDCILCAIRDSHPDVERLLVYEEDLFLITLNLYPFNPGHLMIFPRRHVTSLQELNDKEALALHRLTVTVTDAIDAEFSPSGYNIGFNLGQASGASIAHIHRHIVPRYPNELGFIDIISGDRIMVVDPREVQARLQRRLG